MQIQTSDVSASANANADANANDPSNAAANQMQMQIQMQGKSRYIFERKCSAGRNHRGAHKSRLVLYDVSLKSYGIKIRQRQR